MQFEFFVPTRIIFGEDSLSELSSRKMPGKKALLVTSCGIQPKQAERSTGYIRHSIRSASLPQCIRA